VAHGEIYGLSAIDDRSIN